MTRGMVFLGGHFDSCCDFGELELTCESARMRLPWGNAPTCFVVGCVSAERPLPAVSVRFVSGGGAGEGGGEQTRRQIQVSRASRASR